MDAKIYRLITLLTLIISSVLAIFPITDDRYITQKAIAVPAAEVKVARSSKNALNHVQKQEATYSNTSQRVLNLVPGISVLETDSNNECYFVNTIIGKNEYPLIIDTGSAYLWVYGEDCTDPACQDHKLFTLESSSSSQDDTPTSTFALSYVTGSAIGEVIQDHIIVNKLATTQKFKFGMAKTVPEFFGKYPVSGIFGLPSNDSSSIESIISALYSSHAIGVKRFSISIGKINPKDDYPNAGIFAIGTPIDELYNGEIHYVPLISNSANYWVISIDGVKVNDVQVYFNETVEANGQDSHISRRAIVDSGTTVLAIPKQDALDLHSYFEDSITDGTNYAILCNSTLNVSFDLNNKSFEITPDLYIGPKYSSDSGYYGYCVSNIQGVESDHWILGAVFLKTVYADFNLEDQAIGFAERNTDVVLTSTASSMASESSTINDISTSATDNSTHASSSLHHSNAAIGNSIGFLGFSFVSSIAALVLL